jgi:phosphoribosylcarboxyaminoimidazole (NCAIR) mutase
MLGSGMPIIGPPMMSLSVSGLRPAAANRCEIGVPMATSKLRGRSTLPATVTMRGSAVRPCSSARQTASAVATLKHCTP